MASSNSLSTRKRSRIQEEEEDLDELTPRKLSTTTPVSTTSKKRKITTYESANGNSLFSSPKNMIKKFLGFGGGTNDADELSGEKDTSDPELSEPDEPIEEKKLVPKEKVSAKKQRAAKVPNAKHQVKKATKDIFDLSSSEVEKEAEKAKPVPRKKQSLGDAADHTSTKTTDVAPVIKRPRGRPRKSDVLKREKIASKQAVREKLSSKTTEQDTNRRRSSRRNEESPGPSNSDHEEQKSSNRSKKQAKTHLEVPDRVRNVILSPSRGRPGLASRKSVTFEHNENDLDLGFKDLPRTTSAQKSREGSKSKSERDTSNIEDLEVVVDGEGVAIDDEGEADDAACSICLKLHTRKGNQILFCDGCDKAVHQKCYGVKDIPEGNWFCKDCIPNHPQIDLIDQSLIPESALQGPWVEIVGFEDQLKRLQRALLDKMTGQTRIKLRGHDEQMQKVYQVVEQTVLAGEGNSMLVIGGRGCGKTTLVESVISEISFEHREHFHVVRLNGFIHTDDKLALKEIWRQLGREMEVEDDMAKTSNHADTLASLLALLSHPSELSESSAEQTAKSVIFVLDEFDLFTTHARQTLLYNLFDIAQARKAPIAVLGLTTRIDVVESLEKRVKSRFSHRYVYLSLPRSPPVFWDICKEGLTLDEAEAADMGFDSSTTGSDEFLSFWNAAIEELYERDESFKEYVQSHYFRTKSVSAFLTSCILPVATLTPKSFPLTGKFFASTTLSLSPPDSKLHILQGLSELELALLIAAARLDIILDTDTCNFAMVYDEYSSLTSRHKIQTSSSGVNALGSSAKVWGRDVALGAWERLAEYEVLIPAAIGGSGGKDIGMGGRMWKVDVGLEEIPGSVDGLSSVMTKWCREI
ncbi:hypothetical protein HYALB_00004486 [Hymenoscyphus albidus]|uniref:Origin recognition complex subunit 4 n=1 Tax=Hymenoscyphus albidus TaxID=595503 RepID=A0A9N9M1G5_9HELO|nr:hypothetical protein HYALB_00004486 [Hymenoscyphus albidus]